MANGPCGHPTTDGTTSGNCSTDGCWNHYAKRHEGGPQRPGA
jgi:hypothetical protein